MAREVFFVAQPPIVFENRIVCKYISHSLSFFFFILVFIPFSLRFMYRISYPLKADASSSKDSHQKKKVIEGEVLKGKNSEIFALPFSEENEKKRIAKLSVKIKGYQWSEPIELPLPSNSKEVFFLRSLLFTFSVFVLFFPQFISLLSLIRSILRREHIPSQSKMPTIVL